RLASAARHSPSARGDSHLRGDAYSDGYGQHFVRSSEIQPRPEPGSDRGRDVDSRLHRSLALETSVAAEDSIAIAGGDESERRGSAVSSQIADRRDVPPNRSCLERLEDETAAVAPAVSATLDCLGGIVDRKRGLQERDTIVVTVRVGAGEMDFRR